MTTILARARGVTPSPCTATTLATGNEDAPVLSPGGNGINATTAIAIATVAIAIDGITRAGLFIVHFHLRLRAASRLAQLRKELVSDT